MLESGLPGVFSACSLERGEVLDHTMASVRQVRAQIAGRRVQVRLIGTSNPEGAAAEAQIQAELLADPLGRELRFEGGIPRSRMTPSMLRRATGRA